jgi:3-hydroxy-9,10-secoandrosta-1,3,5(10)-triene-9,17-dione monooxygenase
MRRSISANELNKKAEALIPFLKTQSNEVEKNKSLTKSIINKLHNEGLFRYHQPKLWGGMELEFSAWLDIPEILSRGDCSTGWSVANIASHHRTLALFSEEIQDEIWSDNPDVIIAAGNIYNQGVGKVVDGGLVLSGKWNFCSAIQISEWCLFAFLVKDGDKILDWSQCIVHKNDYEIVDDWDTMGMRGTGSCTVIVKDLFIPEYRIQSMAVNFANHKFKGVDKNKNPMFQISTPSIGGHGLAGCSVGGAQLCYDIMKEWVLERSTSTTGIKMKDIPSIQYRLGEAASKIDAARLILRNDCVEVEKMMLHNMEVNINTKLKYKRNASFAVQNALDATRIIQQIAGANGIYNNSPIQKAVRDVQSCSTHIHFSTDLQMTQWGRIELGGEFTSATM